VADQVLEQEMWERVRDSPQENLFFPVKKAMKSSEGISHLLKAHHLCLAKSICSCSNISVL
jgi:hypothetical protein